MPDLPDSELLYTPDEPPRYAPPKRPVGLWVAAIALIAAIAAAAYIALGRRQTAAPVSAPPRVEAPPQSIQPLGGDAASIVLPPLEESDPLVRELVKQMTSHPRVAAWLTTDGLIRNFTVVVQNVAEGGTPAVHLRVLRPSTSFHVVERNGDLFVDPRSYERYSSVAAGVASIDPAGAARLYATFKPRIEEAYRELGFPDTPFDRTLERAIVSLLETPVLDGPVRVRIAAHGIGYDFADPRVEALTGAQKQLLRAGSRNVQIVRSSLHEIALALGIPAQRLPEARAAERNR